MNENEQKFLESLLKVFREEAEEYLQKISNSLMELEQETDPKKQVPVTEGILKNAHSLKGAASSAGREDIVAICRSLEDVLFQIKKEELLLTTELFDGLYRTIDLIREIMIQNSSQDVEKEIEKIDFLKSQTNEEYENVDVKKEESKVPTQITSESIRVPINKLDNLVLNAEELLTVKLALNSFISQVKTFTPVLNHWKKEWNKLNVTKKLENNLMSPEIMAFILSSSNQINSLEDGIKELNTVLEENARFISPLIDNMMEEVKKIIMVPFSSLVPSFKRMVRDLSHKERKEVELVVNGSRTEIDKRVLEEMKDAFIHLIRNCIDHGIEKPEIRKEKGNNPRGTIEINLRELDSNRVEIIVKDDGQGISFSRIKEKALNAGLLSVEKASKASKEDLLQLIFRSEISTSPIVTDLSGRGLGMSIVLDQVEKLGGKIKIETSQEKGTSFHIVLPLTMATSRGVVAIISGSSFVIPVASIRKVLRVKKDKIKTLEGKETMLFEERTIPLARTHQILNLLESNDIEKESILVMVLGQGENQVAFEVDQILHEQEVMVKNLGKQLARVKNVSGSTLLGSGELALILNPSDLIKSAIEITRPIIYDTDQTADEKKSKTKKSILVVEDSITSRTLLKNILEASGYHVTTAIDGVEGLTALKSEEFDLVVSDIQMPRMNGFDLVTNIRSDQKLRDVPVVLVTALSSQEDKERGIEVGANAYIVKSSFDQNNLLKAIKRLV